MSPTLSIDECPVVTQVNVCPSTERSHAIQHRNGITQDVKPVSIKADRPSLRLLLAICDDGTQERVARFKQQCADTPDDAIPSFLFKPDLPYVKGLCFSCGTELPEPWFGRCARCALAWRLAAGVDIPGELAAAVDGARVA